MSPDGIVFINILKIFKVISKIGSYSRNFVHIILKNYKVEIILATRHPYPNNEYAKFAKSFVNANYGIYKILQSKPLMLIDAMDVKMQKWAFKIIHKTAYNLS